MAFVDLKSAFDLVLRLKLWQVLRDMGMPLDLLALVTRMQEGSYARTQGVRQGCVLAAKCFPYILMI